MSSQNNARGSLFGALFIPGLILGGLIIVAIIVISYRSSAPNTSRSSDKARQLDDSTLTTLRDKYDALGIAVGDEDAPITIREFADYQCPACAAFSSTARRVRKDLVDSGKARFVFFDFPLPMHDNAHEAAVAARCAERQNKFWPYHDRLFESQRQWTPKSDPTSMFLDLAVETGINADRLEQCIDQGATDDVIAKNQDAGKAVGLRATPTVIVGNTMFSGAVSFDRIQQAIDKQAAEQADN